MITDLAPMAQDHTGAGEITISTDTKELAIYTQGNKLSGTNVREVKIHQFPLMPDRSVTYTPNTGVTSRVTAIAAYVIGEGSIEYAQTQRASTASPDYTAGGTASTDITAGGTSGTAPTLYLSTQGLSTPQTYSLKAGTALSLIATTGNIRREPTTGRVQQIDQAQQQTWTHNYTGTQLLATQPFVVTGLGVGGIFTPPLGVVGLRPSSPHELGTQGGPETESRALGKKVYELKDHLGNVRVTLSDAREIDGNAIVKSYSNYLPFGMAMPRRNFSSNEYRYGFNGKEKDDEVKGAGNSYDYGMRMYDPRIGRPFSIDPLTRQYPELSPYQFFSNNPIWFITKELIRR